MSSLQTSLLQFVAVLLAVAVYAYSFVSRIAGGDIIYWVWAVAELAVLIVGIALCDYTFRRFAERYYLLKS